MPSDQPRRLSPVRQSRPVIGLHLCDVVDGTAKTALKVDGWLVVEQDMLPRPDDPPDRAARDQQHNREYLRAHGL